MTSDHYQKAFEAAIAELAVLSAEYETFVKKEEALEDRMNKIRLAAISLAELANLDLQQIEEKYPDLKAGIAAGPRIGITDAVRQVLAASNEMLTPIKIRDGVFQLSPSIAGHKNPLASIHAVIRRLIDSDQVVIAADREGNTSYGWIDCDDFEERIRRWVTNEDELIKKVKASRKKKKA